MLITLVTQPSATKRIYDTIYFSLLPTPLQTDKFGVQGHPLVYILCLCLMCLKWLQLPPKFADLQCTATLHPLPRCAEF